MNHEKPEVTLIWALSGPQCGTISKASEEVMRKVRSMRKLDGFRAEDYNFSGNLIGLTTCWESEANLHYHDEARELSYRGSKWLFEGKYREIIKGLLGADFSKTVVKVNYYVPGQRWYEEPHEALIRRYRDGRFGKSALFAMKKKEQPGWKELWAWICHSENLHAIESPKPGTPAYRQAQAAGKLEEIRAHNDFMALGKL